MKKVLLILLCMGILCGCAATDRETETTDTPEQTSEAVTETASVTEDNQTTTAPAEETVAALPTETEQIMIPEISPDLVGIYIPSGDGTKTRIRITEFSSKRSAKKDIDCFEIFASDADTVTGSSFREMWIEAWESHEEREGARIGFVIEFAYGGGEELRKTLLKPSDAEAFYEYLEIYMYDDIHQTPGQWYTHLDDDDMTEDTVISSIKLTAGSKIDEVGDIILTAFIYNGDDCFNANGDYIGTVKESLRITR